MESKPKTKTSILDPKNIVKLDPIKSRQTKACKWDGI